MNQVKNIVKRINAYMIYCKAKRFRAQAEKEEEKFQRKIEKYGCYGAKSYPWSKLCRCRCGNKHPWMHGFPSGAPYNEIVREEPIYRAVCHRCFRHTKKGTFQEVVEEWNTKKGINYKKVIADWEGYPYIEPDPLKCGITIQERERLEKLFLEERSLKTESEHEAACKNFEEKNDFDARR